MRVFIIDAYSPAEVSEDSTKDRFYSNLRKSIKDASNNNYKPILLGDLNSTIGMNLKTSGAWDYSWI